MKFLHSKTSCCYEHNHNHDEYNDTTIYSRIENYIQHRGHYVGIHASGFKDFMLKPELLRAIVDAGFEHPSEVQHETIPQAVLGGDIICQAKSGMGKTAVFTLATLQQVSLEESKVSVLVICHTRELAFQIAHEYERFSKYLPAVKTAVFYGGVSVKQNKEILKNDCPHIVVGTPGRILGLARDKDLKLDGIKHFVLDECDRVLESLDMRRDIQEIFRLTPHEKQVCTLLVADMGYINFAICSLVLYCSKQNSISQSIRVPLVSCHSLCSNSKLSIGHAL